MNLPVIVLTRKQFDELPEYSCSLPTGVIIGGKRWKRSKEYVMDPSGWYMGEYVAVDDDHYTIRWYVIRVKQTDKEAAEAMRAVAQRVQADHELVEYIADEVVRQSGRGHLVENKNR